jgi:hypothetical protein
VTSSAVPAELDPGAQAAFDRKLETIEQRRMDQLAERAMWRTHHWPEEYDRCTTIAGRPVCRRCLTLYPAAIAVGIAFLLGWSLWPAAADPWLIWALCLPATADFVLEQTGTVDYSVRRQVLTTALLAPAVGRGLGYELTDSWSWEFWGPVLTFCTLWFVAATAGPLRHNETEHAHG